MCLRTNELPRSSRWIILLFAALLLRSSRREAGSVHHSDTLAIASIQHHRHSSERLFVYRSEHTREYIGIERKFDGSDIPRLWKWKPGRLFHICCNAVK